MLMMFSVLSAVIESLFFVDHIQAYQMQFNQRYKDNLWLLFVPVVVAPLFEEWLYRGIILSKLNKHLSFGMSNTVSSFLFAIAHLDWFLLPYFLNGLVYGWVKERTDNFYSVIVLHGAYNAIAVAILMNT